MGRYPVIGLNALKYFWSKKTPAQAADDVAVLMQYYSGQWNKRTFILVAVLYARQHECAGGDECNYGQAFIAALWAG
jgi:hypothetical protein